MNKTIVASMAPLDVYCVHVNDTFAGCHFYIKNNDTDKRVGGRHDSIGAALEACIEYFRHSQDAMPDSICVAMPTLIHIQNQLIADGVRVRLNEIEAERQQPKPEERLSEMSTDDLVKLFYETVRAYKKTRWELSAMKDIDCRFYLINEITRERAAKLVAEEKPVRELIPVEFEIKGPSAHSLGQLFLLSKGNLSAEREKLFELAVEKMNCTWGYGDNYESATMTIKGTLTVPKGSA